MTALARQIEQATSLVRRRWGRRPRAGIILGTGLGELAGQIDTEAVIPYEEIPHFPASTALGHKGQLVCGTLGGTPVVTMDGRFHIYEGYRPSTITLPVRVMRRLGAELLIVSNASGGMNPRYTTGDIVVIVDHINLMWTSPLLGDGGDRSGAPLVDMSRVYDPLLIDRALAIARREDFPAHRGVYVALTGPNYETRAEYRMLRRLGGDVVGMSTVPEVIVAARCGLRVLALSTVTNVCRPDALPQVDPRQVVRAASRAEPNVRHIVLGILADSAPGGS